MHLSKLYLFLGFLIGFCFCGSALEPWPSTKDDFFDRTWHADFPLTAFHREPLSFDDLYAFAKSYYAMLMVKLKPAEGSKNANAVELVAALYVPSVVRGGKGHVYISTIPRGSRKAYMAANKAKAPVWGAQVANLRSTVNNHANPFHAEDGVYFNFESTNVVPTRAHYPHGSKIAVYGRFELNEEPDKQPLCGREQKMSASRACSRNATSMLGSSNFSSSSPRACDSMSHVGLW